jgi:S1-C subfamily serine protease
LDELLSLLSGERVGKPVPAQIVRGGKLQDVSVTIGERS